MTSNENELTIKRYLDKLKEANNILYPLFKKTKVAKLLGIKYDTLIRRMDSYLISPDDLKLIIELYSDQLDTDTYNKLNNTVTEEYKIIENLTTLKVKSLPITLQDFGKITSINYNKIMDVVNGRDLWGLSYLGKISSFFEYLSTIKNLHDERNFD